MARDGEEKAEEDNEEKAVVEQEEQGEWLTGASETRKHLELHRQLLSDGWYDEQETFLAEAGDTVTHVPSPQFSR